MRANASIYFGGIQSTWGSNNEAEAKYKAEPSSWDTNLTAYIYVHSSDPYDYSDESDDPTLEDPASGLTERRDREVATVE